VNILKLLNRCAVAASLAMSAACGYGVSSSQFPAALTPTNNSIVATPSPSGALNVAVGSSTAVNITFTTNDGAAATNLLITGGLSTLPAGWSGPPSFTCASVSTGSGCVLNLTYHPTAPGSGSVTLSYSYTNNAGTGKTGTAVISYAATSSDYVVATASPAGQVAVVVGGSRTVGITFTTNNGQATNLSITAGLSPLPAGWSGPASFTCASVNTTGNGCLLDLTFAPSTYTSGTLQLYFSYTADTGIATMGSVTIPYTATTNNNLHVAQSPSGSIGAVVNSSPVTVTLTFTTDDGHPATAIAVSGLGSLPPGWSGPATFSCASASTGTGCQLTLTYAPTVNGSGTVALPYSYNDDSGTPKTGTANIPYASIPGFLYSTDNASNVVRCAVSGVDGSLSGCANAFSGFRLPTGIAFSGNWAYVTPGLAASDVDVCAVGANGGLSACASAQTFGSPSALAVSGGYLYVADANGPGYVYSCTINNANGGLSACNANYIGTVNTLDGIAATATTAYAVDVNGGNLTTCTINADGTLFPCTQATLNNTTPAGGNTPNSFPRSASVYGGNLYIGTHAAILILPIANNGSVTVNYPCSPTVGTSCTFDTASVKTPVTGFAFNNGYAYVGGYGGGHGIGICQIGASGILGNCTTTTNPSLNGYYIGMAVH